jgi:hypothetical protein
VETTPHKKEAGEMKLTVRALLVVLTGVVLSSLGATPAVCGSDEFCAMGGTLVKAEVVRDKAVDWVKGQRKAAALAVDTDTWAVLALSKYDDDIAVLVKPDGVFFGVPGKGGRELGEREIEKAFGKDLRKLRELVKRELTDLWKDGVVKISGGDVQSVVDAVGLGTVEKKGRDWELTTQDCTGLDIDTSEVK